MPKKKLRFAPYGRVSTEVQAAKGESLRTQKEIIKKAVRELGGTIPKDLWKYSGQEHSTVGEERVKFNELLADCYTDKFDAIIVADFDRTGRDISVYVSMVEVLKETGVEFYVRTERTDWYQPTQKLGKDIQSAVAEFHGMLTAKKSFENRVAKAKRGVPACGAVPLGSKRKTVPRPVYDMSKGRKIVSGYKEGLPPLVCRKYDFEKERWVEDKTTLKCKQILQQAAKKYLEGDTLRDISDWINKQGHSCSYSMLGRIFRKRCGDKLEWKIESKKINQKASGTMYMPPALDDKTIKELHHKMNYVIGHERKPKYKEKYLLGGNIKCGLCGRALVCQTNPTKSYYRHNKVCKDGKESPYKYVPVAQMDKAVFNAVFEMIGDSSLLKKAVFDAVPGQGEIEQLKSKKIRLTTSKSELRKKFDKLVDAVAEGLLPKARIKAKSQELETEIEKCESEIRSVDSKLVNLPSEKDMGRAHQLLKRIVTNIGRSPGHRDKMTFNERRELLCAFFDGFDSTGRKLGCYVFPKGEGKFSVEIIGKLVSLKGGINFVKDVISCYTDTCHGMFNRPKHLLTNCIKYQITQFKFQGPP